MPKLLKVGKTMTFGTWAKKKKKEYYLFFHSGLCMVSLVLMLVAIKVYYL
jgi:hypothetical protein